MCHRCAFEPAADGIASQRCGSERAGVLSNTSGRSSGSRIRRKAGIPAMHDCSVQQIWRVQGPASARQPWGSGDGISSVTTGSIPVPGFLDNQTVWRKARPRDGDGVSREESEGRSEQPFPSILRVARDPSEGIRSNFSNRTLVTRKLITSRQTDMRMIALLPFTTLLGKTARALARSGINRHVT
jgi:hypothetical protein